MTVREMIVVYRIARRSHGYWYGLVGTVRLGVVVHEEPVEVVGDADAWADRWLGIDR